MKQKRSSSPAASPSPRAQSSRPLKVGETLRHALAGVLMRGEVHDAALLKHNVTVSEVRMSPDLAHATVFVTPLGGGDGTKMMADLKRCAPMLRREVAHIIKMRHAPELHFQPDTSFDYAGKIADVLLGNPVVASDLKKTPPQPIDLDALDEDEA